MSVTLGNETYPEVKGSSAKKTKKEAACVVLQDLIKKGLLQRKFKISTPAVSHFLCTQKLYRNYCMFLDT
ncbi:hypothetical protein DPMN_063204 [Dreissena polymorpha]|uniref:DRBM domain-containing protein n=1 Tax=Dreissena polymorpha TaxID=45954 RepID=A0A9D4CAU0_DREPO|nr:hypothetical protein DPMN_063204 [Dreissena polymorpha]